MKPKILLGGAVLSALVCVVAYQFIGKEKTETPIAEQSDVTATPTPSKVIEGNEPAKLEDVVKDIANETSQGVSEEVKAEQEKLAKIAEEKQKEIESLLLEYDENLSDPEKRQEIQEKIQALMGEYNKAILPVALAKIKENEKE